MKKSRLLQYIIIFFTVFAIIAPVICIAKTKQNILILPFKINSKKDLSYLNPKIQKAMEDYLSKYDADIILYDENNTSVFDMEKSGKNSAAIKSFGILNGADAVIWGNVFFIKQQYSIDIKCINTLSLAPLKTFSITGEGFETFFSSVNTIIKKIASAVFIQETVSSIKIEGNKRIETDAILQNMETIPGDLFQKQVLYKDLKTIYNMGYFDDIKIEFQKKTRGKEVIITVIEKPTIKKIRISGNTVYKDEKILENLSLKIGAILNTLQINNNKNRIKDLYKEKNYHNVTVEKKTYKLKNNQVDLEFVITEGNKVKIKKIIFEGNRDFSDKKLKKIIKTSEKGFFSWLTSSGELNTADLDQDISQLSVFYHNSGYAQARVGEPDIKFNRDFIEIKIKISEGPKFKIGTVDISGDMLIPKKDMLTRVSILNEKFYSSSLIRDDVLALTDIYSNKGYFYAEVIPEIDKDIANKIINIKFMINQGNKVFFDEIGISGNTKTREKVIRRELHVYEQELYNSKKLKRSIRNLYRLDFFEDIKVDTLKGDTDDTMNLKINVTEKPTGTFSFGGGYSSVENVFVMFSVTERNIFGKGQIVQAKAELGGRTDTFSFSFTEPWLFDIPLSVGFDVYNIQRDYDYYEKDTSGGRLRGSYPVFDYTRLFLSYYYEVGDVYDIDENYAPESIKDLEGENSTSSFTTSIIYDSRDKAFNTTEGSKSLIAVEYAGGAIGGDIAFTKTTLDSGWYISLFWSTVGFLHGKAGHIQGNSTGELPDYERFYLGGLNSLRGFDWRDIHTTDENGYESGGNKFIQFNVEFLIPIVKSAGLVGVLFFDAGNVWDEGSAIQLNDLRESAGFGFRWYSPMGPIRIEHGTILDPQGDESSSGRWEFGMGAAF